MLPSLSHSFFCLMPLLFFFYPTLHYLPLSLWQQPTCTAPPPHKSSPPPALPFCWKYLSKGGGGFYWFVNRFMHTNGICISIMQWHIKMFYIAVFLSLIWGQCLWRIKIIWISKYKKLRVLLAVILLLECWRSLKCEEEFFHINEH